MFSFRFGENELPPIHVSWLSFFRQQYFERLTGKGTSYENVEGGNDDWERKENLGRSFPTNSSGAR